MNAKEEFIEHVGDKHIEWAIIKVEKEGFYGDLENKAVLIQGYTQEQYIDFLNKLDYDYDDGFGGQELFGYISYYGVSWSERGEYDGSEWWSYKKCPSFNDYLNLSNKY